MSSAANFGGSNAGFGVIGNSSKATDYFVSCDFDSPADETSYQNTEGFASPPSFLSLDNSCPITLNLSNQTFSLRASLRDQFGTIVRGSLLADTPISVLLSYQVTSLRSSLMFPPEESLSNGTGIAIFSDLQTCGENNSTYTLLFQATETGISSTSCSFWLDGCPENFQPKASSCDYCVETKNR